MKKIILAVAMLLATNFPAMAGDSNSNSINMVEAYDINININSLARYLELSQDQLSFVSDIQKAFSEGLRCAAVYNNEEARNNMVKNAIDYDLKNLSYVLTEEQYKKYLKVLNATLVNRGIKKVNY